MSDTKDSPNNTLNKEDDFPTEAPSEIQTLLARVLMLVLFIVVLIVAGRYFTKQKSDDGSPHIGGPELPKAKQFGS